MTLATDNGAPPLAVFSGPADRGDKGSSVKNVSLPAKAN
jgi:hypothetical protein